MANGKGKRKRSKEVKKEPNEKVNEKDGEEPVAKRTRLKSGAPMRQTVPVQYPLEWAAGHSGVDKHSRKSKNNPEKHQMDVSEDEDLYKPSTSRAALASVRLSKTSGRKELKSSEIQLIRVKNSSDKTTKSSGSKKTRSKRGTVQRRYTGRRRHVRRRRHRKIGRRRRPRRRNRKSNRRSRRVKVPTRRKKPGPRKVHRKMRVSEVRKPAFKQCPPLGHEEDEILSRHKKKIDRNLDQGHDVVREDPLNVRNLCRYLVKSIQGVPADARTSKDSKDKDKNQEEHSKEETEKKQQPTKKRQRKPQTKPRKKRKNQGTQHKKRSHVPKRRLHRSSPRNLHRLVDKRDKRGAVFRRKKQSHRIVSRDQNRKSCRDRQRANRLAEVTRRRKAAGKTQSTKHHN